MEPGSIYHLYSHANGFELLFNEDEEEKYPVPKINDVYHFEKYDPKASTALHAWCWVQLTALLLFISYFFANIASIGKPEIFIYGGFVFLFVYALTELMDRHAWAIFWETLKTGFGLYAIYTSGWFGAESQYPWIGILLNGYFLISFIVTAYFVGLHYKEDKHEKVQFV